MASLFGWDLLLKSVEKDIKNNQDVLVCFTHLVLVSNGFKCVGIGDSKNLDGSETKTESLPNGWNDSYALRYVFQGRLYNLKGTRLDDAVMINMIRVDERKATLIQLNTRVVINKKGSLEDMIPESKTLAESVKKQLIDGVVTSTKLKDESSQTQSTVSEVPNRGTSSRSNMAVSPPMSPLYEPRLPYYNVDPAVGRSDLDPFGGIGPLPPRIGGPVLPGGAGGGGMIFVPPQGPRFNPGPNLGIPGGSLPPGARFDPFRPPEADQRRPRNPDNDEMPPPGFDDMYM